MVREQEIRTTGWTRAGLAERMMEDGQGDRQNWQKIADGSQVRPEILYVLNGLFFYPALFNVIVHLRYTKFK
ncbi:MAG TPA: hypothetical protein PKY20_05145, partial [Methanothrix sp.]|nr:hypothetical protein [Methanothrix sp.]